MPKKEEQEAQKEKKNAFDKNIRRSYSTEEELQAIFM